MKKSQDMYIARLNEKEQREREVREAKEAMLLEKQKNIELQERIAMEKTEQDKLKVEAEIKAQSKLVKM